MPTNGTDARGAEPAVATLHRLVAVLDRADREAQWGALVADDPELRLWYASLAIEARELCDQTVDLLPDGRYPVIDQSSPEGTTHPGQLLHRAQQLATSRPVEQFPPGMPALIIRLIDTVRDHA